MLSVDPELTKKLVNAKRKDIILDKKRLEKDYLEKMLKHLSMTSSVLHKFHPDVKKQMQDEAYDK